VSLDTLLESVRQYYTDRIETYGATPQGVDWNSLESQELRFEQLLKVCDPARSFSVNDYGCGYGALVDYMIARGYEFQYHGYDICDRMIARARVLHSALPQSDFTSDESLVAVADYTVASGIFNVKLHVDGHLWEEYVLSTLQRIAEVSKRGFSFNALTKYSDPEYMRTDLYYADPLFLFDRCKRDLSKSVTLLHDYPLYEFTILVRM
jgi:SAM-dependent methyltransferase